MDPEPRGGRYIPWVTIAIAAANVIVFAIEVAAGGDLLWGPDPKQLFDLGGNFGPATLDGEQWRLLTSMFLHVGLIHLALNMFMGLYQIGQHVERMYGRLGYAALYLFAGLAGSLASALRSHAVSAGASGAIFGILGAYAAYLLLHRKRLDQTALKKSVQNLAFMLAINLYLGFQAKGIDMAAHMGGLGAGFLAGLALEAGASAVRQRVLRAVLVGVIGSALVVGAAVVVPARGSAIAFDPGIEKFAALETKAIDRYNETVKMQTVMSEAERATAIDHEVLPVWAEAEKAYKDAGGKNRRLLDYIAARREAWIALRDALRTDNPAAYDRASLLMRDADAMVSKLAQ